MKDHLESMLEEIQAGNALLLDVRELDEWQAGHLELAQLVPLSDLQGGKKFGLPKNKKLYLHCRSGMRSGTAKPLLEKQGFKTVISLGEGFKELTTEGFELAVNYAS